MKRKKIKLYTHHFTSVTLGLVKKAKSKDSWMFLFFYHIGNGIIEFFIKIGKFLTNQGNTTSGLLIKRFYKLKSKEFLRSFATFLFICLIIVGGFKSAKLIAVALNFKNSIFSGTEQGISHLTKAQQALADQNTSEANLQFNLAYNNFSQGKQQIDEGNTLMLNLLNFLPQTQKARDALDAASLITESGGNISHFYETLSTLSFSPQGLESGGDNKLVIDSLQLNLNNASSKLTLANKKLEGAKDIIPKNKAAEFNDLKNKLDLAQNTIQNLQQIFEICKKLTVPKNTILVLFENNNELRPGGGFIGTFGNFELENARINSMNISSIYDLDGQLKRVIKPPQPLLAVNDRWFLRDSNWFADFPTSAQKALQFYEVEAGKTPQAVITLTPNILINLLKVTGPIEVPSFNVTLDSENFVEKTQAISTISDNLPLNTPKQILADFFPIFLQKLKTMPKENYKQLLPVFLESLRQKQLVLYSTDNDLQKQFENFNWAGKIFDTDRDYLQIVSSNLGGTKTDLSLQKSVEVKSTINQDESITNELTLTIINQMPKIKGGENSSFLRFLVPKGSKLITITGFDHKELPEIKNSEYKIDLTVEKWQQGMIKDIGSETYIGTESEKTFFGNWINIAGGETKVVKIKYLLPFKLSSLDRHSFILQKQIGSQDDSFKYELYFSGKSLAWENFVPNEVQANNLNVSGLINKDIFLGMVLQNR